MHQAGHRGSHLILTRITRLIISLVTSNDTGVWYYHGYIIPGYEPGTQSHLEYAE